MKNSYTELNECLACWNTELIQVLDLGNQPLANSYVKNKGDQEQTYPLVLNYCRKCTHLQLSVAVNPDLLFRDYLYVSGTSHTLNEYFREFVGLSESYLEHNNHRVLDIACNDGTLLNYYQDVGWDTWGIDPSENLYRISAQRHLVELDYLNWGYAELYKDFFDVVVAQNVMAHNAYPREFLAMCKTMISETGKIFIQNSQGDMVANNEFDTIYHEHLSFYSVESFRTIARAMGLTIIDIQRPSVHGNSFLFVLSKDPNAVEISYFDDLKLNDQVVEDYAISCLEVAATLKWGLQELKRDGYRLIGYGAAAKGNTLLNFAGINLDYIVDDNPLKQGLYTPGMQIEIKSPESLREELGMVCIVPLAWNFFDEIKSKCETLLENAAEKTFVRYFPKFEKLVD